MSSIPPFGWLLFGILIGVFCSDLFAWRAKSRKRPPVVAQDVFTGFNRFIAIMDETASRDREDDAREAAYHHQQKVEVRAKLKEARARLSQELIANPGATVEARHMVRLKFDIAWSEFVSTARRLYGRELVDRTVKDLGFQPKHMET